MLDIFDLGTMISYKEHIIRLHSRYGPQVWLLLYQADTRFRGEHLLRIRRRLADAHGQAVAAGGTTPFDKNRPWSFVLASGLADRDWWHLEFGESAVMLVARTANMQSLVSGDAPVNSSAHVAPSLE